MKSGVNTAQMIWRMLDERYPERISFLDETDGYRFLITVMLSASTTDSQAEKAACRLFSVFPDAASVGNADEASIEALIRTAGLSRQKAGRIKAVSSYVAAYGIPSDAASLMALPGIGEKTAACYLVNILGEPAVIADTHFVRTARRLGFTDTSDRARAAAEIREYCLPCPPGLRRLLPFRYLPFLRGRSRRILKLPSEMRTSARDLTETEPGVNGNGLAWPAVMKRPGDAAYCGRLPSSMGSTEAHPRLAISPEYPYIPSPISMPRLKKSPSARMIAGKRA